MLIPSGVKVTLAKDNDVLITHRLGGFFTVRGIFGIARIEEVDADALGIEVSPTPPHIENEEHNACETATEISSLPKTDAATTVTIDRLWEAAKTVFDPEIPVNIVDLGLVYRLEIFDAEDSKKRVEVDMTLTAPGCSMGPVIANDLKMRIEALPSILEAKVNIVWDPPWNKDMMSEEARMILGLA